MFDVFLVDIWNLSDQDSTIKYNKIIISKSGEAKK